MWSRHVASYGMAAPRTGNDPEGTRPGAEDGFVRDAAPVVSEMTTFPVTHAAGPWLLSVGSRWQIGIGMVGLVAGFLFYAMFRWRSPALVQALVGTRWYLGWSVPSALRPAMQALPTALHVFAFSLLTIGVTGWTRWRRRIACVALWVGINVLFEWLQGVDRAAFTQMLADLPWRFDLLRKFVVDGVCDPWDMAAAVVGGALALLVAALTGKKENPYAAEEVVAPAHVRACCRGPFRTGDDCRQ